MQINEDVLWWCCTTWSITTLFFLVLICSQIQTSHIQKAKEGSMIHKPPRRGPKKVKKKKRSHFHLPPVLTAGTFPNIASLITQKWSREDRLAWGGKLWKQLRSSTCAPGKSVLCPHCGRQGRVVLIDEWGERRASRFSGHMLHLCKDTHYLQQSQAHIHGAYAGSDEAFFLARRDAWSCHDVWVHLNMPGQPDKRSLRQIRSLWTRQ